MSFTARQIALAGLLRSCEPPARGAVTDFVSAVGAEVAWRALADGQAPQPVMAATAVRLAGMDRGQLEALAIADLRSAERVGAVIIGPGDPQWPGECFGPLEWVHPYDACPTAAAPLALYARGQGWPRIPRGGLAVVGSRAATPYGVRVTTELAAEAATAGATVVSGAAFGIDAAAHRGALHSADLGDGAGGCRDDAGSIGGAATVAVLACGIDRAYPMAHRALLDAIATQGAVLSEYPPGSVPARHRFLVRNRLIAALAEATVVVEAGRRSGSLNTATTAAGLGRTVLAVPGPVSSAMSVGCHDLLREGRATLVTSWRDVAQMLGPLAPAPAPHHRGDRAVDGLDLIAGRVHDALPTRGVASVDALCVEAALPVGEVLGALAVLQSHGLADRADLGWRRARPAALVDR